jgi:hypothetical protein
MAASYGRFLLVAGWSALIGKRPLNHPHMNCTLGDELPPSVVRCTLYLRIQHPGAFLVRNTSVVRQPSTSGLVEIKRNSVGLYRSFRDAPHTYTEPSLFISRSVAHMLHASLPPSVMLCYAHVHALPEPSSPCNLPNQSGYGCIQVPLGESLGPHLRTKHCCWLRRKLSLPFGPN